MNENLNKDRYILFEELFWDDFYIARDKLIEEGFLNPSDAEIFKKKDELSTWMYD